MKRILTVIAATATLAGVTAPAAYAQEEVTMLTGKVFRALRDCDIDGNMVDSLTMAQVAGITVAAGGSEESEKCQRIQAIAKGN